MDNSRIGLVDLWSASTVSLAVVTLQKNNGLAVSSELANKTRKKAPSQINLSQLSSLFVSSEEEDIVCLMLDLHLTPKDIFGIKWGGWYIKPRSLHWWTLYRDEVIENDHERFRRMFRVSIRTFKYLCNLVDHDMLQNSPTQFRSI